MPRKGWVVGHKRTYLSRYQDAFRRTKSKGKLYRSIARGLLCRAPGNPFSFDFKKNDITDDSEPSQAELNDIMNTDGLDEVEITRRRRVLTKLASDVGIWLRQQNSKKPAGNVDLHRIIQSYLSSKKKHRKCVKWQFYSRHFYDERVKDTVEARYAKAIKKWERRKAKAEKKGLEFTESRPAVVSFRNRVTCEVLESESPEFKAMLDAMYQEEVKKRQEAAVNPLDFEVPKTPQQFHAAICTAPLFMQPLVDVVAAITGGIAALLLCVPMPDDGGELGVVSAHCGKTRGVVNEKWPDVDEKKFRQVESALLEYGYKVFSAEERKARALPEDEVDRARQRRQAAAEPEDDDDTDDDDDDDDEEEEEDHLEDEVEQDLADEDEEDTHNEPEDLAQHQNDLHERNDDHVRGTSPFTPTTRTVPEGAEHDHDQDDAVSRDDQEGNIDYDPPPSQPDTSAPFNNDNDVEMEYQQGCESRPSTPQAEPLFLSTGQSSPAQSSPVRRSSPSAGERPHESSAPASCSPLRAECRADPESPAPSLPKPGGDDTASPTVLDKGVKRTFVDRLRTRIASDTMLVSSGDTGNSASAAMPTSALLSSRRAPANRAVSLPTPAPTQQTVASGMTPRASRNSAAAPSARRATTSSQHADQPRTDDTREEHEVWLLQPTLSWSEHVRKAVDGCRRGQDWESAFADAVQSYVTFEQGHGFPSSSPGRRMNPNMTRPDVYGAWTKVGRPYDRPMKIGMPAKPFREVWWAWWGALMPPARRLDRGGLLDPAQLVRKINKAEDWEGFDELYGKDGLLQVLLCLLWWGDLVHGDACDEKDRADWEAACTDFSNVLDAVAVTLGFKRTTAKRKASAKIPGPSKKSRKFTGTEEGVGRSTPGPRKSSQNQACAAKPTSKSRRRR